MKKNRSESGNNSHLRSVKGPPIRNQQEQEAPFVSELEQLVERIVEVAQPTHVYLFGSRARGDARADSDYDFLVIADRPVHTRRESTRIRRHLRGFKTPIDVIVARSEQVERYKDQPSLIYHVAMNEGKLCYERP